MKIRAVFSYAHETSRDDDNLIKVWSLDFCRSGGSLKIMLKKNIMELVFTTSSSKNRHYFILPKNRKGSRLPSIVSGPFLLLYTA